MNKKIEPKFNKNKNNFKGFTIIEVVLVLAIAGLIFLMVFLALPALQRAQRDTQRKQDVAMVVTALHNWKANNQGRGYTSMGNSILTPLTKLSEEEKKYNLSVSIDSVKNSPLNNYIGFSIENNTNKNDSSSSLSLNTTIVSTISIPDGRDIIRLDTRSLKNHERIEIVFDMGCGNIEQASDGAILLRDIKKGTAAVIHSLESGGAYCQEA